MAATDWQTELSSLKERNMYALNKSLFTDVEFTVVDSNEDKVTLQAHKYVLAISSPVFEAMFYGDLAETGRTIDLPDCTKEGLQELLHYVYSDEVNFTGRNVMDVLYVAQKYMMPFLEKKCNEYLQEQLQPEEVFIVLPQAQQLINEKAEHCCWNVVDFDTRKAVTSEPFLDISLALLCQVLARETLHVEEITLFKAVDKWASNQIEEEELKDNGAAKRNVLGEDVVRLIRFPVMSHNEFAEFVLDSNILLPNEVNEIIKLLCSATKLESVFNHKKREGQWSEKWAPVRFEKFKGSDHSRDYYASNPQQHRLRFQVSKPIFLAGVKIFGFKSQKTNIKLTVAHFTPGFSFGASNFFSHGFKHTYDTINMEDTSQLIDGSYHGFTVLLEDPVPLEPNDWYCIQAELSGQFSTFAGSAGRDVVKCDDITITFKNDNADDNCTTVEEGQFPSFLLKRKIDLKKNNNKKRKSDSPDNE